MIIRGRRRARWPGTLLALGVLIGALGSTHTGVGVAGLSAAPTTSLLYSSAWPLDDAGLSSLINRYVGDAPGRWSILVKKLDTGQFAAVGSQQKQVSASLYKLFVLYEVFRQWDAGTLRLDETLTIITGDTTEDAAMDDVRFNIGSKQPINTLLTYMITVSDNTAAAALIRRVGYDNINRTLQNIGLRDSQLELGNNMTSATDMADLLERIALGRAVSSAASRQMLDLLLSQQINDLIPAGLPTDTPCAHKTGALDGLRHDAAIVYSPSGPYLFVILSGDLPNEDVAYKVVPQLSAAIYRYFNDPPSQPTRYFPTSKLWLASPFLRVWNTYDGATTLGAPIGPEQVVDGYHVQWFERGRLGLAPGTTTPEQVEFGNLGREALGARRFDPVPDPHDPAQLWVADTGQVISGAFLNYWQRHGGTQVFGNPISPLLQEAMPGVGTVTVQYFEHARMELRGDEQVTLTELGRQLMPQP